jgi:hypothetical protein
MRESRGAQAGRLDIPGLVSSAAALFALTYGLIEGHDRGWTSAPILGSFALAAAAAAVFMTIESRSQQPMVALSLFRSRVFSGGTVTMMLWAFGIFGIYFFTSLYLQDVLGFSPTKAGLAFVPMALFMAIFAFIAGPVAARLRPHRTVALGMAVIAVGLVLFARLGAGASFASLMPGFLLFGAGAGLMNAPLTNAVLHSMPSDRSGVASALLNASREVAGLLGITIIGAVLRARQGTALAHGTSPSGAFLDGYHAGLVVTIGLVAAGAVLSYLALRDLPATVTGAEPAQDALAAGEPVLAQSVLAEPALAESAVEEALAAELAGAGEQAGVAGLRARVAGSPGRG